MQSLFLDLPLFSMTLGRIVCGVVHFYFRLVDKSVLLTAEADRDAVFGRLNYRTIVASARLDIHRLGNALVQHFFEFALFADFRLGRRCDFFGFLYGNFRCLHSLCRRFFRCDGFLNFLNLRFAHFVTTSLINPDRN